MTHYLSSKVSRLYTHEDACYIKLENPTQEPKEGYFKLDRNHPNYNALFSLACMAAMSRRPLTISTRDDIVPTEFAEVVYLVLDF